MNHSVAIVGAGLMGRMLAVHLSDDGWNVTLFDRAGQDGKKSCAHTGAGMLAPISELDRADQKIAKLGDLSMSLWPSTLEKLPLPVEFHLSGTLLIAHIGDESDLERMVTRIRTKSPAATRLKKLTSVDLAGLEPELATQFNSGWFVEQEGHLDNRQLLDSLGAGIRARQIVWHEQQTCTQLAPHRVEDRTERFDWVIDCRGLGAHMDLQDLRGVRGELLHVHAPEVTLHHPVRLAHPRYPLYVVPRSDHLFVVGATEIESDDAGPITVRSALELLSAAYSMHSGFSEGRLVETCVACRPAFPDNLPRITCEPGLLRVNGLYRHGFLLAPLLVEKIRTTLATGRAADLS